jgi:large subunit ribosomal protein L30
MISYPLQKERLWRRKMSEEKQDKAQEKPVNPVESKPVESGMFAVVLVRGLVNIRHDMLETLNSLRLRKKNACVLVKNTKEMKGMLVKAKDYITYGEVNSEVLKLLKEKMAGKKHCNLAPPVKGFGRKGIKKSFSLGGALGYRGDKINDLIKRMI